MLPNLPYLYECFGILPRIVDFLKKIPKTAIQMPKKDFFYTIKELLSIYVTVKSESWSKLRAILTFDQIIPVKSERKYLC